MSKFIGRRCNLGVAVEATRGAVTDPVYFTPFSQVAFDQKTDFVQSEQGVGKIEEFSEHYVVGQKAEGTIEAELYDKALGAFLKALLGSVSSAAAGGETLVYEHTLSLSQSNQHASLSIYFDDPNGAYLFPMAMIDSFTINVKPNDFVKYEIELKSKGNRGWSTKTKSYTSLGKQFLAQHVSAKVAANIAGIAAASTLDIKGLTLKFRKNAEHENVLGTVQPIDVTNHNFLITGELIIDRSDDTFRNYMIDGTQKSLQANFLHPDTIGNAEKTELNLQFPKVHFHEWEKDNDLGKLVEETIPFTCYADLPNALASISSCVLTNMVASY
jgi:hypothetical protein